MPPFVSIIIPCYNEQATIGFLLDAILAQTYPRPQMEVVIADGLSQDGTLEMIEAFHNRHADLALRVVDNPLHNIPAALNKAMTQAHGEIFLRLDAHSIPMPEYVERCVQALRSGLGSNVGGVWLIRPGGKGWIAQAIAAAAAHPLGVGDAGYRRNASAGPVDTVPFGAFRRELIEELGNFDETLLANEDYEFNARIRQAGGVVWLEPQIQSTYISRASLADLAEQYWRYGYWKFKMLRRYPRTLRWRQALPPAFVLNLVGFMILSLFFAEIRPVLILETLIYLLILAAGGLVLSVREHKPLLLPGLILAILTMHLSWGSGFLWSLISTPFGNHV
jgi:succinoglycan biosynthesis protein ExoA